MRTVYFGLVWIAETDKRAFTCTLGMAYKFLSLIPCYL